ncbi:SRPBCC family protein [Amorphoplanes digitatis]|uniref:Carbon monoxide dehydrogenase subunit G n=1 Tax=Actinoplanes digitatis TaxID=1868 RepID=A0A7W7I3L3_9ACTN|nr:SRPBCC family protein [Actinoplanes digitatis]MBB4765752.1 carbon monoxide dehydrogenase subunit G [Actinoplanes digitatis]GID93456.1 polyketide cyclase [Actinoplanes digitatis]
MITISRTFTVAADVEAVLAYLMDFGNTNAWDSATRHTVRTDDGPLAVGASWHNTSKILGVTSELTYTLQVVERDRLVFAGRSEGATSTDTITVRPVGGGSEVTYHVELEMHGLAKLATPVMRMEFEKLGDETAAGLTDALNRLTSAA